jgi:hypothetical protein
MTCPACNHPRTKLLDGSETCTWSEAWRAECEARAVLAIPDKLARREYLRGSEVNGKVVKRGIFHVRGAQACKELEAMIMKIWESKR